ncbi:MAG: 23S rRNA (uracil(1939)-C(5))-methyltransferase RlmD, partial [Proteobacteria bacterium]|nr:23S rRNA (uracil(1939)-C(5))-methyltransferase RlmD [Pseudomonadota bacterium]
AHINGKTVFVVGALAGEQVRIQITKTSRNFDQATTLEVIEASASRIEPKCDAFQVCGGCSLQYLDNDDQVAFKQQSLLDMMQHAGLEVEQTLPPLRSSVWGYRRKARLGVKYVRKKGRVLVGFRERNTPFLADMSRCEVLIPQVGERLGELAELIERLDARESIPQIEVAADDHHVVLVFRHLEPLSGADRERMIEFARHSGFWLQLQAGGPDSIVLLYPEQHQLYFSPLANSDIRVRFGAADFTQVNADINQQMVEQALRFLNLQQEDRVLDLFCGLGNFSLPIARLCTQVTGVEVGQAMVARAKDNALAHAITNSEYFVADLSKPDPDHTWMRRQYDKILLDPPRLEAVSFCIPARLSLQLGDFEKGMAAGEFDESERLLDAYAKTWLGVRDLADKVRLALDGFEGTVTVGSGSITFKQLHLENDSDALVAPSAGKEKGTYRVSMDLVIWHTETVPTFA